MKKIRNAAPPILLFIILLIVCSGKNDPDSVSSRLIADADTMYAYIEDIHPDLFAGYPKAQWLCEFERVKSTLTDSTTHREFALAMAKLLARLCDGHTGIPPETLLWQLPMPESDDDKLFFPLHVQYHPDYTMTLAADFKGDSIASVFIPKGTEILTINGLPAKAYINALIRYISGEKNVFRIAVLNNKWGPLNYCSLFPNLVFTDSIFNIEYKRDDAIANVAIPLLTMDELYRSGGIDGDDDQMTPYTYHIDHAEKTAVLEFNSFEDQEKFNAFAYDMFSTLKQEGITHLIIDIRNNGGGNTYIGDELFQYISPVPFHLFGKAVVKITQRTIGAYREMLNDYQEGFVMPRNMLILRIARYSARPEGITVNEEPPLKQLRDNPYRFEGNVYLLTGDMTFSAASSFAWAFNYFRMGTLIGAETGGNINSYGDMIMLKMPHTKLGYTVSHKKMYGYGATDKETGGVKPDYEIPAGEALDFARDLIRQGK